jgi:RNA polymerase sigma-70 factor (ECF subfamily)
MPPWSMWWRGRDTIAGFAPEAKEICAKARMLPMRANGQLAVACYAEDAGSGRHLPLAIDVLTLEGALIKEITAFVMPQIFPRLRLPAEL